jgi:hypothetical protein
VLQCGAVVLPVPRDQTPPEARKPPFLRTLPFLPGKDHLRAVQDRAVEDDGDLLRELDPFSALRVVGEIPRDPFPLGEGARIGKEPEKAPGHPLPGEGIPGGNVRQHAPEQFVHDRVGEGEPGVREDAEAAGQLLLEPPLHVAALDDDRLRIEGR